MHAGTSVVSHSAVVSLSHPAPHPWHTGGMATTRAPEAIFDDFVNGKLSKGEWTHEAHLITAHQALQTRTAVETLTFLRDAIKTHNCGISIQNTDSMGYHETLTRYYVTAVSEAISSGSTSLELILAEPTCGRTAALDYWTRTLLFSAEARLGWVGPDLAATPWPVVDDSNTGN